MFTAPTEVGTYEEFKAGAATMCIALFGLRYGQRIPNREGQLELGISMCNDIARGRRLITGGPVEHFEDIAAVEAFTSLARHCKVRPEQLAGMADNASEIRSSLESARQGRHLTDNEWDAAAEFFKKLYNIC